MKRITGIVLALCLAFCGVSVYAQEIDKRQITGIYLCTGKLFYCDTPTNRVVIKSVKPVVASPGAEQAAQEAEYLEISIAPEGLRMNDGSIITPEYMNVYTDSNVRFVLTKSADGFLAIPFLRFK